MESRVALYLHLGILLGNQRKKKNSVSRVYEFSLEHIWGLGFVMSDHS